MHGIIYRAFNVEEQKSYIGQSKKSLEERRKVHLKVAKFYNFRIYQAFREYGVNAFIWEVLEEIDIEDERVFHDKLNELEIKYIAAYKSFDPTYGYNDTYGGRKGSPTPSIRKKIGDSHRGKPGRRHTEEEKRQTSLRSKGSHWSEETKEKNRIIREKRIEIEKQEIRRIYEKCITDIKNGEIPIPPRPQRSAKYVVCLETGILYGAIEEAAKSCNSFGKNTATSCKSQGLRGCRGLHYMFVPKDIIETANK
jgi:group I intron endonuclease